MTAEFDQTLPSPAMIVAPTCPLGSPVAAGPAVAIPDDISRGDRRDGHRANPCRGMACTGCDSACHGRAPMVLRFAHDEEDRQRVFRFRYEVYVEEMRREQKFADHRRRLIEEPFDATGHLLLAEVGDTLVGTARTNFAGETDLGYYVDLFNLRAAGAAFPHAVSLTTKLMIRRELRSGTLAVRLARALFELGQASGIRHDFIDCNAHLEDFFIRLGYHRHGPKVEHPEYGLVQPLRLDIEDIDHLLQVGSPFARLAAKASHPLDLAA